MIAKTLKRLFVAWLVSLSLVGCGDGTSAPTNIAALFGIWVNDDGTTVRAFEFKPGDDTYPDLVGLTNVYLLYNYPSGTTPELVQRGRYDVRTALVNEPSGQVEAVALVTSVTWSIDGVGVGQEFGNAFLSYDVSNFEISRGTAGGSRNYQFAMQLP